MGCWSVVASQWWGRCCSVFVYPHSDSWVYYSLYSLLQSGHSLHRNWALCDWLTVTGWLVGEISWQSELKISRCCPAQNIRSIVNFNWNFLCSELILTGQRCWVPSLGMYLFSPIFPRRRHGFWQIYASLIYIFIFMFQSVRCLKRWTFWRSELHLWQLIAKPGLYKQIINRSGPKTSQFSPETCSKEPGKCWKRSNVSFDISFD